MVPGTWWAFFNTFGGNYPEESGLLSSPGSVAKNTVGQLQMEDLAPEAEAATCNRLGSSRGGLCVAGV